MNISGHKTKLLLLLLLLLRLLPLLLPLPLLLTASNQSLLARLPLLLLLPLLLPLLLQLPPNFTPLTNRYLSRCARLEDAANFMRSRIRAGSVINAVSLRVHVVQGFFLF